MADSDGRELFQNTTEGYAGACQIDRRGERRWIAVAPGETVRLSDEEREAMAQAPREAKNNPFIETEVDELDDDGNVIRKVKVPPAFQPVAEERPTGVKPPQGSYAEHEEPGVPAATW